jgi:hypothetical protein
VCPSANQQESTILTTGPLAAAAATLTIGRPSSPATGFMPDEHSLALRPVDATDVRLAGDGKPPD